MHLTSTGTLRPSPKPRRWRININKPGNVAAMPPLLAAEVAASSIALLLQRLLHRRLRRLAVVMLVFVLTHLRWRFKHVMLKLVKYEGL